MVARSRESDIPAKAAVCGTDGDASGPSIKPKDNVASATADGRDLPAACDENRGGDQHPGDCNGGLGAQGTYRMLLRMLAKIKVRQPIYAEGPLLPFPRSSVSPRSKKDDG